MIETLLLNMFYGGTMKSMPPKLVSDNGEHIVIRPLAYVKEKDIERYARAMQYPIIPCNLCGSQENLQRKAIKDMLQTWDQQYPGRIESMFKAMTQVVPSHLPDRDLYNFSAVTATGQVEANGDIGFDPWVMQDSTTINIKMVD